MPTTHDRKTHDLPTRLLAAAQACEATASEWEETFEGQTHHETLALVQQHMTRLLELAAHARFMRTLYVDGAYLDVPAVRSTIRVTLGCVEDSEQSLQAHVVVLMEATD
jgi:hypothetical protein